MSSNSNNNVINAIVAQRENQANNIAVFTLLAVDGSELPAFEAGAHIDVILGTDLVRQYSISNAPGSKSYRLGVLKDPNSRGGSEQVHADFTDGARVQISAPRNHFPLDMGAAHSLLVGAGIGITPIISMAYALKAAHQSFELHYCCRSADKAAFIDELKREFDDNLVLHFSGLGDANRLNLTATHHTPEANTHIYICGPTGFMNCVMDQAKAISLPDKQIHYEYYSAEVDLSGDVFEVYARASDVTVQVAANESIATALKAAGIKVQMSCEEGVCGTCICDVVEGTPDHRDHFLTEEEKEDNDQIALCCSRAKSQRLVIEI